MEELEHNYGKVDNKEQEVAIEAIAEALDYLKGEHKKFFTSLNEAEKED